MVYLAGVLRSFEYSDKSFQEVDRDQRSLKEIKGSFQVVFAGLLVWILGSFF